MTKDVKNNLNRQDVESIVREYLSTYTKILKGFLWGLFGFFVIIVISGLISQKNLLVLIHDAIFGDEKKVVMKVGKLINAEVGISYHRSFLLYSPEQREERMLFFVEKGQKVKVYIEDSHYGTSFDRRKLIVELDNQILWDKVEDFEGGFKDITSKVFSEDNPPSFSEENVHALEFSLDDTQPINLDDKVFVDCVIIVYGKLSNEEK